MFFGAGAGAFPTASAVMGDVLALATPLAQGVAPLREAEPYDRVYPMRSSDGIHDRYYIRISVEDRPGMLGQVANVFAAQVVPLAQVNQPEHDAQGPASLVLITHLSLERDVKRALADIATLDGVSEVSSVIRVEQTDAWKRDAID